MKIIKNKKSQIAIFIILALIIVVMLILFFLLRAAPETELFNEDNPQAYIEACTRQATEEALNILGPQGGDIEPYGKTLWEDYELVYHCYTNEYYEKCINQRPMLIEHIEQEITNFITPIVQECFENLEAKLEKRYEISTGDLKLRTEIHPRQVVVQIDKKFKMKRGDIIREINHFRMNMIHPIYNLAEISMEIVNQEIVYCNFDELGYMILHPEYDIIKFITGSANTIYILTDRPSNIKFQFATRNCLLPPGLGYSI